MTENFNISKSIIVFLVMMQLCFGVDLGFTNYLKKRTNKIVKFITLLQSVTILIILFSFTFYNDYNLFWSVANFLQYLLITLILKKSKYNFYNFITNLSRIDLNVPEMKKELHGIRCLVFCIIVFFSKFLFSMGWCLANKYFDCDSTLLPYYLPAIFTIGLNLSSVIFIHIYYYPYCYLKHLTELYKSSLINIKNLQKYYHDIAIQYSNIIPLFDNLIITELLFEIPKLLLSIYTMLHILQTEMEIFAFTGAIVFNVHILIRIILPSIFVEMVKSQFEATKLVLHERLLEEKDEKENNEIRRLLRYMEARRLDHKVWRILPLDLQLPITILSLCITYLIVIIQFTHLYD